MPARAAETALDGWLGAIGRRDFGDFGKIFVTHFCFSLALLYAPRASTGHRVASVFAADRSFPRQSFRARQTAR
jgi:hypothetical protein